MWNVYFGCFVAPFSVINFSHFVDGASLILVNIFFSLSGPLLHYQWVLSILPLASFLCHGLLGFHLLYVSLDELYIWAPYINFSKLFIWSFVIGTWPAMCRERGGALLWCWSVLPLPGILVLGISSVWWLFLLFLWFFHSSFDSFLYC